MRHERLIRACLMGGLAAVLVGGAILVVVVAVL